MGWHIGSSVPIWRSPSSLRLFSDSTYSPQPFQVFSTMAYCFRLFSRRSSYQVCSLRFLGIQNQRRGVGSLALAHITIHYFRRPLSIVMPQAPSSVPSTPRPSHSDRSPSPSRDPLLQRKERLLQRSRFGKRLLWDVVIWIVLIPICGYALVWATGRLARRW